MSQPRNDPDRVRDVIVVGAGPAGLATAIAARKALLDCEVFERAALVNSILHFPINMVFFTTPELLELGELPFVTPYAKPTRDEALRYYRRVVDTYELTVRLGYEVVSIQPQRGHDGEALLALMKDYIVAPSMLQSVSMLKDPMAKAIFAWGAAHVPPVDLRIGGMIPIVLPV